MRVAPSLRRNQTKGFPLPIEEKSAAQAYAMSPVRVGVPYRDNIDVLRAVTMRTRVVWIWKGTHAIADSQARLRFNVREGDPDTGPELETHPSLPILNQRPNPYQSAYDFRYMLSMQKQLSPRGAFVQMVRDRLDRLAELYLLPCAYTYPIPDPKQFVSGYRVEVPGTDPYDVPPEDVIWIKTPHPTDPYSGSTALEAAGLAAEADYAMRMYNRNFMLNDARPGGIMVINGDLDPDDMQELRAREASRRGPEGAGKLAYINAESASFFDTAMNARDGQYHEARMDAKDEILVALGTPESVLGNASGRTFDNADAEGEMFWVHTMMSHLEGIARGFDRLDPDLNHYTGFDLSGIAELQRAKNLRESALLDQLQKSAITIDEFRHEVGRDPLGFDKPRGLANWVALDNELPVAPQPIHVINQAPPHPSALPPGEEPPADAEIVPAKGLPTVETKDKWAGKQYGTRKLDAKAADDIRSLNAKRLKSWESTVAKQMRGVFARQEKAVLAKLLSRKVRMQFDGDPRRANPVAGTKTVDPGGIFDRAAFDRQLQSDAEEFIKSVMEDFGTETADALGVSFDVTNPLTEKALREQVNRITSINQTTFDSIANQLAIGEKAGESIDSLAERVQSVFFAATDSRAEMIARTEVIGAANSGALGAAADSGVAATKVWLAAQDDRVRPDHAEADGQEVNLDEQFDVGGEAMEYPGDPNGDASQTVNCRCTLIFNTTDATTDDQQAQADEAESDSGA